MTEGEDEKLRAAKEESMESRVESGTSETEKKPREARSVVLLYESVPATVFYNELTVTESAPNSFFVPCSFVDGYLGVQQHLPGQDNGVKFSVWESGQQDNKDSVPQDQRVEVLYHADDVDVRRFGNEGTGGQSFFKYNWKIGERYRFRVKANTESNHTSYSAYFFLNETRQWKHLATFRTSLQKGLRKYASFIEDFNPSGKYLQERRSARFGNGWVKTDTGWMALNNAQFSGNPTLPENIDAGAQEGDFYLASGGKTTNHTKLNSKVHLPVSPKPPADFSEPSK